jgi:hypothetical protein
MLPNTPGDTMDVIHITRRFGSAVVRFDPPV